MATKTRNLSLDESAAALLAQVGNASAYVSRMVEQRRARLTHALLKLEAQGWTGGELLAVCDAANGWLYTLDIGLSDCIAAEMEDAAELSGTADKWGVTPERWSELCELARREATALALYEVSQEFWAGNEWLAQRLNEDRPSRGKQSPDGR